MDQPPQSNEPPTNLKPTLPVEETPIIEPIDEHVAPVSEPPTTAPSSKSFHAEEHKNESSHHAAVAAPVKHNKGGCGKVLGNIIFFVLLFGLGVWLSTQVRSLLSPVIPETSQLVTPSPSANPLIDAEGQAVLPTGNDGWTSYPLGGSTGEKGLAESAYQLPTSVVAPVCDGARCASSRTNLPGGTRFTVAMRGTGYPLPDFRGAILTDTTGKEFVMKQTTIGGKDVYEYTGNFAGRTSGGYSFTKMRGVLVPITATTSVDFNHFAPTGITSDFAADDALFDQIISRLVVPSATK